MLRTCGKLRRLGEHVHVSYCRDSIASQASLTRCRIFWDHESQKGCEKCSIAKECNRSPHVVPPELANERPVDEAYNA